MDSRTCFAEYNGRQYAILNWELRRTMNDAIISRPLLKDELALYEKYKRQGKENAWIFRQLFPPRLLQQKSRLVSPKDLTKLGKNQLIHLILSKLHSSIPSLNKMTKPDLRTLYLALDRLNRGRGLNLLKAIAKAGREDHKTEDE